MSVSNVTEGIDQIQFEHPYNAWITKFTVEGAEDGPLSGMEIGLKDNIALAGYEMTCGSSVLEGYVPQIDATVATRLLALEPLSQ